MVTPDERHAVVACRSMSGTNFIVFDITKSTEIAQTRSIALDAEPKVLLALSNSEMVTGTRGGHLIQWNIHSCAPTFTFEDPADLQAHRGPINSIQISSDYENIVSASSDCTAKIWSSRNKMLVSILAGHRAEVELLLFIWFLMIRGTNVRSFFLVEYSLSRVFSTLHRVIILFKNLKCTKIRILFYMFYSSNILS